MNNWKVGTRIGAGFGLLIVIAAALGGFAFIKVQQIEANARQIVKEEIPKLEMSATIEKNLQLTYSYALEHSSTADKQEEAVLDEKIAATRAANTNLFAEFDKRMTDEGGKAALSGVKAVRSTFVTALDQALTASRSGTTEGNQRARAILATQVRPLQVKYTEAVGVVTEYNKSSAEAAGAVVESAVTTSRIGILLGITIAVIAGILISILTVRSITKPLGVAMEAVDRVSRGDLTRNIEVTSKDELGQMLETLNRMVESLRSTVYEVNGAAARVATGSDEMSATAEQLSQGSSEQAASAEETTSAMEEMASSVQQNADNARQTDKIASTAAEDARSSGEAVNRTVHAMKEVAGKINIIEEIARKTDLLALNAAVEAARAGEHGKGFAVVASEVRKLAERSQTAAAEISQLTNDGVKTAEGAGQLLAKLVPDIRRTAELVREIAAASGEQSTGASQINQAIQQLDQVIQQNASASSEMASTAEELASQSETLRTAMGFFKVDERRQSAGHSSGHATPAPKHAPGPERKATVARLQKRPANVAVMQRHDKTLGPAIELGSNTGNGDSRDVEFAAYRD